MFKKFMVFAMLVLAQTHRVAAGDPRDVDFHWLYQAAAAQRLFRARQYEPARDAAMQLRDAAPNSSMHDDLLIIAAKAEAHLGEYERALGKLPAIGDQHAAEFTRLEIMTIGKRWDELRGHFRDADMTAWPGSHAREGLMMRATARENSKDYPGAISDWRQAMDLPGSDMTFQLQTLNRIAAAWQAAGDTDRALEVYSQVIDRALDDPEGAGWSFPAAVRNAARILESRGEIEPALAMLARFDPFIETSAAAGAMLLAFSGDLYMKMDRKTEALHKYRAAHACAVQWGRENTVKNLVDKIAELENEPRDD